MSRTSRCFFAIAVVLALGGIRFLTSGPDDLDLLHGFRSSTMTDAGPSHAFFATGLHGDAATYTIIALDPAGEDLGRLLFLPTFRYTRYGYPLLAALLTLGREQLVLLGLSAIGLVSVGLVAYLTPLVVESRGWRGWLLLCNPPLLIGALNDTAEPLALLVLVLALLTGSVWMGVAVAITRPSYLVALGNRARILLVGLLVAFGARLFWSWRLDESWLSGGLALALPLTGFLETPSVLGLFVVAPAVATMVIGIMKRDAGWVLSGLIVMSLGAVVYDTPTNAVRAAGILPVLWAFGPKYPPSLRIRELFGSAPKVDVGR